ncbi:MAG: MFS transporter [Verrucomicrobia bacterium]|nr:MFS transporter [Verrucomicrobiota bacterium]
MFRRTHIAYALAVLMDMCLMATVFFAVPRRAADGGMDAVRLAWLSAAFFATYAIVSPIAGKLADRFGRGRFMVAGLIASAALVWACTNETDFAPLTALVAAAGIAAAVFWPPLMSWMGEGRRGAALAGTLAVYCICWNVGLVAGSLGGGALYERDPRQVFWLFGAILAASPLLLLARTRVVEGGKPGAEDGVAHETARFFMWAGWLANLVALVGLGAVTAMFPQLATHLDIRPALHGQMLAASRAAAIAAFVIMGWSHAWRHRMWPLLAGCVVSAAGALAIATTSSAAWFFAGFIALGFVSGASYLAGIYYAMEAFEGKAVGAGWTELTLGAGMFLGPVAAGFAADAWGLRAPYYFAAMLFTAGLGGQIMLAWAVRRRYKLASP